MLKKSLNIKYFISTLNKKSSCLTNNQNNYNKNIVLNNHFIINNNNNLSYQSNHAYFSSAIQNNFNNKEWTKTLTNAEKVVGYPTSFLNLRYLVSDEVANFANLLRKLMKTKHPLIKMTRRLITTNGETETKRTLQINGLLVLLIAKAAGIPKKSDFLDVEISDGIHSSQRCLAEITEMIYMGSLIHKGILDLKKISQSEYKNMEQGNKLAVLCGDYLLANACTNLSKLKNTQVVDLMSEVIADISQSVFIYENFKNKKFTFLKLWYEHLNSNSSSLMANSAKSAMLLVSHSPKLQEVAWNFAKNLDITYKIWSDLIDFKKDETVLNNPESILNAVFRDKFKPNSEILIENESEENSKNNDSFISKVFNFNKNNKKIDQIDANLVENIFNESKLIFQAHYKLATDSLEQLENEHSEKDALASLKSILNVMKNSI